MSETLDFFSETFLGLPLWLWAASGFFAIIVIIYATEDIARVANDTVFNYLHSLIPI